MEEKTTYASKNTLERKKQSYELRIINDNEEIDLIRQRKHEEREGVVESAKQHQATIRKDHEKINAETGKLLSEIHETMIAEVNRVKAVAELRMQEKKSETKLIETKVIAEGRAKANEIRAEAEAYVLRKDGQSKAQVAEANVRYFHTHFLGNSTRRRRKS